jgi:hypothetical protein
MRRTAAAVLAILTLPACSTLADLDGYELQRDATIETAVVVDTTVGDTQVVDSAVDTFLPPPMDSMMDSTMVDTTVVDSAMDVLDTAMPDTFVDLDTGTIIDSGIDTEPVDTGTPDTFVPDTTVVDTGPPDTGTVDTGVVDTGTPLGEVGSSCSATAMCGANLLCCPSGHPCAGKCVPDCTKGAACPMTGQVCCNMGGCSGLCLPDCRIDSGTPVCMGGGTCGPSGWCI